MVKIKYILFSLLLVGFAACGNKGFRIATSAQDAQGPNNTPVVKTEFKKQVIVGYQGWFAASGDGFSDRWTHWAYSTPSVNNIKFELYPDVREYNHNDLFPTDLGNLGNGQPSKLFSSSHIGVTDLHFKWMQQYGIDGAALQRFVSATYGSTDHATLNQVASNVRTSAEKWGRSFYIMYDISGARTDTFVSDIKNDWVKDIEGQLHFLDSPNYARQDGRPVVCIWGVGPTGTPADGIELSRWFKARGVYVIIGGFGNWRDDDSWRSVYLSYNMIQPWMVGGLATDADVDDYYDNRAAADRTLCKQNGVDYVNVMFPGFAWSNWNGGPRNAFPRRGGKLLWRQAYRNAEAQSGGYIAMFDEYDEGTAIAKAAETKAMTPNNQYFLSLDEDGLDISSDFYLRLAGEATKMIQGKTSRTPTIPISLR